MRPPLLNRSSRMPRISVVMAVYNTERFIAESVESVLKQTFEDFEFIIVDDASSDKTQEIIRSYDDTRIRLLANRENLGQTISLNMGLGHAQGEFIARQDGDDVSLLDRFERQLRFLDANPDVILLGTGAHIIDEQGRSLGSSIVEQSDLSIKWRILFENSFCHPSLMWRRDPVGNDVGGYDPQYPYGQDYDFVCRVAERLMVANLSELLVRYRRHPQAKGVSGTWEQRRAGQEISVRQLVSLFGGDPLSVQPEWIRSIAILEPQSIPLDHVLETFRAFKMAYQLFDAKYDICSSNHLDNKVPIRRHLGNCVVKLLKWLIKRDFGLGIAVFKDALVWDHTFLTDCLAEAGKYWSAG